MEVIAIVACVIALLAILYALRCRSELKQWANLIKTARIAVAYKRKVHLQGPLSEWALWCKMLDDDKSKTGYMIYRQGGTSVVLTKALPQKVKQTTTPTPTKGKWSATDQTPAVTNARG